MSRLYLYAIVGRAPTGPLGLGLRDEPLSLVTTGRVTAVVGEMDEAPVATADAVRGHDAVVRRLADVSEAILPARFGTVDEAAGLLDGLASAQDGLGDALRLVAGREQMTLHVFDVDPPASVPGEASGDAREALPGPGARYLAERRHRWRRTEGLPELARLRARLDGLVAAERVEPRDTPPLRASVYHLIARGRSAAYRDAVERHLDLLAGVRLRVSGPWAPYAFAPSPSRSASEDPGTP